MLSHEIDLTADIEMVGQHLEKAVPIFEPPDLLLLRSSPVSSADTSPPRLRTSFSSHPRLQSASNSFQEISPITPVSMAAISHEADGSDKKKKLGLLVLPEEIQQRILDLVVGQLRSSASAFAGLHAIKNWDNAMRHPRGKMVSQLASVSKAWRRMVQERMYRHLKIKGTTQSLLSCSEWFLEHPHLAEYVKHVEFWVPIWAPREGIAASQASQTPSIFPDRRLASNDGIIEAVDPPAVGYRLSSEKATLDDLFHFTAMFFGNACIMTIEGGYCKKPPMIMHFRSSESRDQGLSPLPKVNTLVLRGAWNIMREEHHFQTVVSALPNLREWHCSYTKPKAQGYRTLYSVLRNFPCNLTHLNICLEGFYHKNSMDANKLQRLYRDTHLCEALGKIMPQLEVLTYTGRICSSLFAHAFDTAASQRTRATLFNPSHHHPPPRLHTVELRVKNCCRPLHAWSDAAGIHSWSFIQAFEELVAMAAGSLAAYPFLRNLRIHFVDLDAPCPLLNPYFQLSGDECTGIWSDSIIANLRAGRPKATYPALDDGPADPSLGGKPWLWTPAMRPRSIKIASYAAFSEGQAF